MKILIVTHHYLDGFGGGVFGSRGFINALAELSDNVTLLFPLREGTRPEGINRRVRMIPVVDTRTRLKKMLDLISGIVHRFGRVFPKVLDEQSYDLVVFDACYPSFRQIDLAHSHGCKVITIHHNFQWEYTRDNARWPTRPFELFWTKRCERDAVRKSDLNLTVTDADRELMHAHYDPQRKAKIHVIGDFESVRRDFDVKVTHPSDPVFLITGDLGAVQTEKSFIPWVHTYYPILRRRLPSAELIVAGKNPSGRIRRICREQGFCLIDTPSDMAPVLAQGRYYICPTSMGGGLKLRIMDGLRSGMPVLTHVVSARGYERFLGYCLFAYDDPASFANALENVLKTDISPAEIIALYRSVFSFEAGVSRMRECLTSL